MELQKYFDALLAGIHITLDYIHVTGGEFYDYRATDNTASRGKHVRSLIFQKISIDCRNALHSLTYEFPVLDLLKFNTCEFQYTNTINVDKP